MPRRLSKAVAGPDEIGAGAVRMNGVGAHEVIIETTDHYRHLALQPVEHVADVIRAYLQRYRDLRGDSRFEYGLLFRNHGRTAGAVAIGARQDRVGTRHGTRGVEAQEAQRIRTELATVAVAEFRRALT